jgi:short-subunit dehydrogenase
MSVSKQNNFLITGGSTGLGFSIAHKLLKDGHKVICTTRDLSKLTKEAKSLEQLGCKWLSLDLSSSESINELLKNALDALNGHIDVLINGAAYALMGAFEDTP